MSRKSAAKKIKDAIEVHVEDLNAVSKIVNNMTVVKSDQPALRIKKAKLTDYQTVVVGYREEYEDGGQNKVQKDCGFLAHQDLLDAFRNLIPHLIMLCDLREVKRGASPSQYELEDYEHIKVHMISLETHDNQDGVVLLGTKEKEDRIIECKTPFIKWVEAYEFVDELHHAVSHAMDEVQNYLNGKCSQKQLKIELNEEEEEGLS
jgi:hypothetical protein